MKAVHVLPRIDAPDDGVGVDLLGERHLHENAVDRGIGVELVHVREQLVLGRGGGQANRQAVHPRLLRGLPLAAHVHRARRVLAHEHDGESRTHAARDERRRVARHFGADVARDGRAVDELSGQSPPPVSRG